MGVLLIDDDDAGRYPGTVEEVRGETDDPFDESLPDQVPPDIALPVTPEEHTVREDDRALPGALQRRDQVEEERIVAVLRRRDAVLKPPELVTLRVEAARPGLGREGRICNRKVKLLQAPVGILEVRVCERIVAPDLGTRMIMEEHIHPREGPGGVVHLLAVYRYPPGSLIGRLEEEGARPAGRVVEGLVLARIRADADHLRDDPGDLGRRVELPLALPRLGGEVPHQVLVGVAEQVVALGAVCPEVKPLKYRHKPGEAVLHLFSPPELRLVVEVRLVDDAPEIVCFREPADDLVDPIADLLVALQFHHIGETSTLRHHDDRVLPSSVPVGDVLHKQQREDVVLVLRGIHTTTELIATAPEGAIEFRFLDRHWFLVMFCPRRAGGIPAYR